MFVCVCTYHEPVAGYTYLNSQPVYKVIKAHLFHLVNVSSRTRKTHFISIWILKNTKTQLLCVYRSFTGRSALFTLVSLFFTLAPDVAIRIIVQDWRQICQITFFITGGVAGGSCVCPHGQNLYLLWVFLGRGIRFCNPF